MPEVQGNPAIDFMISQQEQTGKLREIRASFLDVAIEIEIGLRAMLVEYFIDDPNKRDLFESLYEGETLGRIVKRFNKVLTKEQEALSTADVNLDELKASLHDLVENRNVFAHQPMDAWYGVNEHRQVVHSEVRIGPRNRSDATFFNVETAKKAYEDARHCEELVLRLRLPFLQLPHSNFKR